MITINRATMEDFETVAEVARLSFLESHGHSASPADIDAYVSQKLNDSVLLKELSDDQNVFHLIYVDGKVAGYSKIVLNGYHPNVEVEGATKLERLYLLRAYYGLSLGRSLLEHNISFARKNDQRAMWLFVWIENITAYRFYIKFGFEVIGNYDFKISDTHSNPNHQMLLRFTSDRI
jgi:diamine N-acetyltransferase